MDAIRKLFAGNDDTALFYFSGHGYMNSTGAENCYASRYSYPWSILYGDTDVNNNEYC